jgi:hypothetical protein
MHSAILILGPLGFGNCTAVVNGKKRRNRHDLKELLSGYCINSSVPRLQTSVFLTVFFPSSFAFELSSDGCCRHELHSILSLPLLSEPIVP